MPSIESKNKLKSIAGRFTLVKALYGWTSAFGFDALKFVDAVRGLPLVLKDYYAIRRMNRDSGTHWKVNLAMPRLADKYSASGVASGHYFHQDLLVARRIFERNPRRHVDVGSRVDGFVAHVATFRQIEVLDIRPLGTSVPNIIFTQADLMDPSSGLRDYCDSLSCLHALEHFGLGRYGDPLNIDGHRIGFANLSRILSPGGLMYLSLPIGEERIEFNAHRVFDISTILGLAAAEFELVGFSYVDDLGNLHENVELTPALIGSNCSCRYGCGIFELRKLT